MANTKISSRTPAEILARLSSLDDDFFGKRSEVLIFSLSFSDANQFLKDDANEAGWVQYDPMTEAASYLEFAIDKMQGERGLSASRSVDAFREYVWLLTDDATAAQYEATDYGWYGHDQLLFAARKLGLIAKWNELTGELVES